METVRLGVTLNMKKKMLEYREANALFMHYGRVSWIASSIFYSAAFAIIGLTWQEKKWLPLVIVTSLLLWFFALLLSKRLQFYCNSILNRLWILEEEMGLNVHRHIKNRDEEEDERSSVRYFGRLLTKIRILRYLILVPLVLVWVLRVFL